MRTDTFNINIDDTHFLWVYGKFHKYIATLTRVTSI